MSTANEDIYIKLIDALQKKHLDTFKRLLPTAEYVDIETADGFTLLSFAVSEYIENKDYAYPFIEALLKHKANPNQKIGNHTLFFLACAQNKLSLVKLLLKYNVEIDARGLFASIYTGNLDIFKLFLNMGANVNSLLLKDKYGKEFTPILYAIDSIPRGKLNAMKDMLELLLKQGGNIEYPEDGGPLVRILDAAKAHTDGQIPQEYFNSLFELFLKYKMNPNRQYEGKSILALASEFSAAIVKLLLENGADPNIQNESDGATALFHAMYKPFIFKRLVDSGVNLNIQNKEGYSILHMLALRGDVELFMLCVEKGADINLQNEKVDGKTPLYLACLGGMMEAHPSVRAKYEIIQFILAQPTFKPKLKIKGKTILQLADTDQFSTSAQDLLREALAPKEIWQGWTQADAKEMDTILTAEDPDALYDYSYCPVCLLHQPRTTVPGTTTKGCMYLHHDCRSYKRPYHKALYNKYKNVLGEIEWCVICNRITFEHRHLEYADPDEPKARPVEKRSGSAFDKTCKAQGGGGIDEKLQRYIALRKFAKELNERAGHITREEATVKMVEAFWRGGKPEPKRWGTLISRTKEKWRMKRTLKNRRFKPNTANYPAPKPAAAATANVKLEEVSVERSAENMRDLRPEISLEEPKMNAITYDEGQPSVRFQHRTEKGDIVKHDEWLSFETVRGIVKDYIPNFGTKEFGQCPFRCGALLYPDELKDILEPKDLEDYTEAFRKFKAGQTGGKRRGLLRRGKRTRKQRGGDSRPNFFGEMTDAVCSVPRRK
jgi:ankyrin repeat protein